MRVVLQAQIAETFDLALIASFYLPIVFFFVSTTLTARFLWGREAGDSVVIGFVSTFGNAVMLGVPVVVGTFGDITLTPMVGIVGLHAVAMYLMGVTLIEVVRQKSAGGFDPQERRKHLGCTGRGTARPHPGRGRRPLSCAGTLPGQRNEPAYLRHTARAAARQRSLDEAAFAQATCDNFFRLFDRVPPPAAGEA